MPRFSANTYFYPMTIKYLNNRKIQDPNYPENDVEVDLPGDLKIIPFQPYNYQFNWDRSPNKTFISDFVSNPLIIYYLTANMKSPEILIPNDTPDITVKQVITTCGPNCDKCTNLAANTICNRCTEGYFLLDGVCFDPTYLKYFLLSPGFENNTDKTVTRDIVLNTVSEVTDSITVSFFVSLLGWNTKSTYYDIFRYGPDLALRFDYKSDKLTLYSPKTTSRLTEVVYGEFNYLYQYFDSWIHISLAYFYDNTKPYFPAMMNFQVELQAIQLSGDFSNLHVNNIVIPKENIAIFARIWIWNHYLVGSYGFYGNSQRNPKPVKRFTDWDGELISNTFKSIWSANATAKTRCLIRDTDFSDNNLIYACVNDYSQKLMDFMSDRYCFMKYSYRRSTGKYDYYPARDYNYIYYLIGFDDSYLINQHCPYGLHSSESGYYCSCDKMSNDTLIFSNGDKNICELKDFLDFNYYDNITIKDLKVSNDQYTLAFWIYIYTYKMDQFSGFDIYWDKHSTVSFSYSSGKYKSTCYPMYNSTDSSYKNSNSPIELTFDESKAWVFVRCSVDVLNKKYLSSLKTSPPTEKNNLNIPVIGRNFTLGATSSLVFSAINNRNRGVIFLRKINLWSCYNCYGLNYNVMKDMEDEFLLHLFDPIYNRQFFNYTQDIIETWTTRVLQGPQALNSMYTSYNIPPDYQDTPAPVTPPSTPKFVMNPMDMRTPTGDADDIQNTLLKDLMGNSITIEYNKNPNFIGYNVIKDMNYYKLYDPQELTYFPETNIFSDFVEKENEYVLSTNYFSNSTTNLTDSRNGKLISPWFDVKFFFKYLVLL